MIEDYSYEGADFRKDLEIPLPKGEEWDDWGKKGIIHHVFNFLDLFNFYFVMLRQVKMICVDIGHVHPARMFPIERQGWVIYMVVHHFKADEELGDLGENLHHLIVGILDVTTNDLPRCY